MDFRLLLLVGLALFAVVSTVTLVPVVAAQACYIHQHWVCDPDVCVNVPHLHCSWP